MSDKPLTERLQVKNGRSLAVVGMPRAHGLDTVSQIAVDDDWSAMRLKRI